MLSYFQGKARYWPKITIFHTPCIQHPRWGSSMLEHCHTIWYQKLEWYCYKTLKKSDDMFSHFERILACDGRTETDRRTDIL